MKLANCTCGLQSHFFAHPCLCCESADPLSSGARRRSLRRIQQISRAFNACGRPMKDAKQFKNCINMPLLEEGDDNLEILLLVPPPELHLLLGIVSRLIDELSQRSCFSSRWPRGLCLWIAAKKFPLLAQELPPELKKFAHALNAFDHVRECCFRQVLHGDFKDKIEAFWECFQEPRVSTTPKIHCLLEHVGECCSKMKHTPGPLSKETVE